MCCVVCCTTLNSVTDPLTYHGFCCCRATLLEPPLCGGEGSGDPGYVAESITVVKTSDGSLDDCVKKCASDSACHFVEYRYTDSTNNYTPGCFAFKPTVGSSAITRSIYYKLPPSMDPVAAQSAGVVRTQSNPSGMYAQYSYPTDLQLPFAYNDLATAATIAVAADICNSNSTCWGFVETAATGNARFALKTGHELANARTIINSMKDGENVAADSNIIVQPWA